MRPRLQQHGVALITALLIVALATVLAVSLMDHLNFDTRRTENILRQEQAMLASLNVVDLTRKALYDNGVLNNYDFLEELYEFNQGVAQFPLPGSQPGVGSAVLSDLHACFNLNNLVVNGKRDNAAAGAYNRLLSLLLDGLPQQSQANIPQLVDSLVDWMDENSINEPNGAEYAHYLGKQPPYRSANRPLVSLTELALVEGYRAEIIQALANQVCILPAAASPSPINVNTASAEVLQSVSGLTQQQTQTLLEHRDGQTPDITDDNPFQNMNSFQSEVSRLGVKNFKAEGMAVASEYFLLKTQISLGEGLGDGKAGNSGSKTTMYSMIYRNPNTHATRVVQQSRSVL